MTRKAIIRRDADARLTLELVLEDERWGDETELQRRLDEIAPRIAAHAEARITGDMGATIVLADDAAVRDLNKRFRGQDKPTNVLSFPAGGGGDGTEPVQLGDVIVAFETVEREAKFEALTREQHMVHLVIHGVLHLVGHDHVDDADAALMEGTETAILAALGIADPYTEVD